jgi:hypothetical protein
MMIAVVYCEFQIVRSEERDQAGPKTVTRAFRTTDRQRLNALRIRRQIERENENPWRRMPR